MQLEADMILRTLLKEDNTKFNLKVNIALESIQEMRAQKFDYLCLQEKSASGVYVSLL